VQEDEGVEGGTLRSAERMPSRMSVFLCDLATRLEQGVDEFSVLTDGACFMMAGMARAL
jgi:hypothetical protein